MPIKRRVVIHVAVSDTRTAKRRSKNPFTDNAGGWQCTASRKDSPGSYTSKDSKENIRLKEKNNMDNRDYGFNMEGISDADIFADYDEWDTGVDSKGYGSDMEGISDADIFADYDEWDEDCYYDDETIIKMQKEYFDGKRNISRDRKGRLNKGARLAEKDNCNKDSIISLYNDGMSVKKIAAYKRCSQATVYNAVKAFKKKDGQLF